jgi:hypothetical protein
MNGRMLWWQDGYDQFEKADLCRHYSRAAAAVGAFVRGEDFTDFAPLKCEVSNGIKGAMLGNDTLRLGWFRDSECIPPEWRMKAVSKQFVALLGDGLWQAEFFNAETGARIGTQGVASQAGKLTVALPEFQASVAFKLRIVPKK